MRTQSAVSLFLICSFLSISPVCQGQTAGWDGPVPEVTGEYGIIPGKFQEYEVILEPEEDAAEWWAGAPSVVRDSDGLFWLACRMRTGESPRGLRGYEIRILRSRDGIHFTRVHTIPREEVPIPGFERPALLIDPETGQFKLYGCGPWQGEDWSIIKFEDADTPAEFVPSSAKPVIQPIPKKADRDVAPHGYKDPVIIYAENKYHCYVIGQFRGLERLYHFAGDDGESWQPVGHPDESLLDLTGWHDFFIRPGSVVPLGVGYLFVYEGSNSTWFDPVYNVTTGLAFTFDLHHLIDLTPESPLAMSTTPSREYTKLYHTWRYSDWLYVGDELWAYAEVVNPNGSNEIRLFRLNK